MSKKYTISKGCIKLMKHKGILNQWSQSIRVYNSFNCDVSKNYQSVMLFLAHRYTFKKWRNSAGPNFLEGRCQPQPGMTKVVYNHQESH